jgi:hypothetical protein
LTFLRFLFGWNFFLKLSTFIARYSLLFSKKKQKH